LIEAFSKTYQCSFLAQQKMVNRRMDVFRVHFLVRTFQAGIFQVQETLLNSCVAGTEISLEEFRQEE
jgi:hypothetical protein